MKKARRQEVDTNLNINSMMDMMTIILVFLLKSYSATDVSVAPSDDLTLPFSSAQKAPEVAVNLVIEQGRILVDGVPSVTLTTKTDEKTGQELVAVPESEMQGQNIGELYEVLYEKAEQAKALADRSNNPDLAFKGRILLQVDKEMPYAVLRSVMYTAGQAQFGEFKFVVYKQE
jgi:biopolymer transport protein ExbD